MRKLFTVIILILVICVNTDFAQKKINFEFDYARFKLDENSVYLELYYNIKQGDFTLAKIDNGFVVKGKLSVEIADKVSKKQVYFKDFPFEDKYTLGETKVKDMLGVLGISVPKGEYILKIVVEDLNDKANSKTIIDNLTIIPFDDKTTMVSDIQLASSIFKEGADKNSIFYKSTLEVIPNPAILYSNTTPILYYYLELYNFEATNKTYKLVKSLFNNTGRKLMTTSKLLTQRSNSFVEIGNVNLASYPTENYTLEIAIVDTLSKEAKITAKRFYLYNPTIKKEVTAGQSMEFVGSEYSVMSEKECDKMLDQIKYISTDNELAQIKKLEILEGKKMFLFNFWSNRNEKKGLGINENRVEFDKRLQYANKNYSNMYKEGYKSDRGRIVIKYGIPDDTDRHPNVSDSQPYEVWTYNNVEGEANVTFVFGDLSNFGNYILLHSTKRNETYNENWQSLLLKVRNEIKN
jgi:GWxTD domain-containing protein